VPVTANWRVVPFALDGFVGVTESVIKVAGVTVIVVDADILPCVAEIVTVPVVRADASPLLPDALLIDTTDVLLDAQVMLFVRFCVVLSEYVPVAANCLDVPFPVDGFIGDMEIDVKTAGVTVRMVFPLIDPSAAVMVVVPAATPVAVPFTPVALLMVAIVVSDEDHVTLAVIS